MLIGIVGKPSCGKSTFFKAATMAQVEIANYPFTTIKPNSGVGYVKIPDVAKEFNKIANPREGYCKGGFRFVPVQLIDVAGLVPGAHKGEGMGAQFLNDLNQADVLIHVIDASGSVNELGEPVEPLSYDPANDIKFLEDELDHWYFALIQKGWDRFVKLCMQERRQIDKALAKQLNALGVTEEISEDTITKLTLDIARPDKWTQEQIFELAKQFRKITKPMIIAANKIDITGAKENLQRLQKEFPNLLIVPCSAAAELGLKTADQEKQIDYIPGEKDFKILDESKKALFDKVKEKILNEFGSTGVQQVLNTAVFDLLKYKAIHPGGVSKLEDSNGNVIPDCFLMKPETTALNFAFKIHTDIGKNYVKAINVRTKMPIAKDYVLKNLDIIEIMTSK